MTDHDVVTLAQFLQCIAQLGLATSVQTVLPPDLPHALSDLRRVLIELGWMSPSFSSQKSLLYNRRTHTTQIVSTIDGTSAASLSTLQAAAFDRPASA